MTYLVNDFGAFIAALWPIYSIGLAAVLGMVLVTAMVKPFITWLRRYERG